MCPFYGYCACFSPIRLLHTVSFIFYGDAEVPGQCGLLQIRGQLSMNHPILHGIASMPSFRINTIMPITNSVIIRNSFFFSNCYLSFGRYGFKNEAAMPERTQPHSSASGKSAVYFKNQIHILYFSIITDICGNISYIAIAFCCIFINNSPMLF